MIPLLCYQPLLKFVYSASVLVWHECASRRECNNSADTASCVQTRNNLFRFPWMAFIDCGWLFAIQQQCFHFHSWHQRIARSFWQLKWFKNRRVQRMVHWGCFSNFEKTPYKQLCNFSSIWCQSMQTKWWSTMLDWQELSLQQSCWRKCLCHAMA